MLKYIKCHPLIHASKPKLSVPMHIVLSSIPVYLCMHINLIVYFIKVCRNIFLFIYIF